MPEKRIYFITLPESLDGVPFVDRHPDHSIFLVEEMYVRNLLLKKGFSWTYYLDEFIDGDNAEKYNMIAHALSIDWSKDIEGTDILTIEGVGIGEIYYWHFMQRIFIPFFKYYLAFSIVVEKFGVRKIYSDDDSGLFSTICQLLGVEYMAIMRPAVSTKEYECLVCKKYRHTSPNELLAIPSMAPMKKLYSWFRSMMSHFGPTGAGSKNILVSSYFPTKPVIKKLISSLNRTVFFIDEVYGFPAMGSIPSIDMDTFTRRLGEKQFVEKCVFEGIDCSNHLLGQIREFVYANKNKVEEAFLRVSSFIKNNSIDMFFTAVDSSWINKIAVKICQAMKIPTISLANGIICDNYHKEAKRCDYNIAYSSSIKRDYHGNSSDSVVLGNPYFDRYSGKRKKSIRSKAVYNVFVCSGTYSPNAVNCPKHLEDEYLFDILKVLVSYNYPEKKFNIIVKPHPATNLEYLNFFLSYYGFRDVRIVCGEFNKVIVNADLYISNWSTSAFEAAALGIPVIYYKKDNMRFHEPFGGNSEMPAPRDIASLEKAIGGFLRDPSVFSLFCDRSVLERYIGPLDGYNAERVRGFIERVLKYHDINRSAI